MFQEGSYAPNCEVAGSMWLFDFMDMFYVVACLRDMCVCTPFEGPNKTI